MGNSKEGTVWSVPTGITNAVVTKIWNRLGSHGEGVITQLHEDDIFHERLAEFLLRRGIEGSVHHKLARVVMGNKNFWGMEEWASIYGENFTEEQLSEVADFPWSEDILNAPCRFNEGKFVKDTHSAFLGIERINREPLTILKWHELHPDTDKPRFSYAKKPWYGKQRFATEVTCGLRWYLMLLEIAPDFTDKTYEEQVAMLPQDYEVPLAIEEVTKNILYYRKNGIYLNVLQWGRCQDITLYDNRVTIGYAEEGINVNQYWDNQCLSIEGVAVSRKLPEQITK